MWIKSYLSNRTQRVFFNGSLSNIIQLESGIPQGSCLGPLLLKSFTNDMPLTADSPDTHAYPTGHATRGFFTVPKFRTDYGRHTVLHRAMTTWNSIPHQETEASSKIR
jgi:hypothetical protein